MKIGETWKARNPHKIMNSNWHKITISSYISNENWYVECDNGEWEIYTSSYIFENYERDYDV
jgi:hypothetical protein